MIQEPNENFDLEGQNFQLAGDEINSETMENQDPGINQHEIDNSDSVYEESDLDTETRNDYDPYQDDLDDDDIDQNIDEDLDDDGDGDGFEEDFDENDRSDY